MTICHTLLALRSPSVAGTNGRDDDDINTDYAESDVMLGGGANSAATETLGDLAIFSSDFGGNPPYEKMYEISRIVYKHWLAQSQVLFIIGGKANNTDIFVTVKAMMDALKDHIRKNPDVHVVIGRGGPNVIQGRRSTRR